MELKIRNPKAEGRKKAELRNRKGVVPIVCVVVWDGLV